MLTVAIAGFVLPNGAQAAETSPVKYQEVKYSVMKDCIGNTAPECTLEDETGTNVGYLFAGWYKTADNTSPIDELSDVENATDDTIVYAKFIPSYLAGIACQVDTNKNADTRNLRVVSLIDSTNYKSVGFNVYGRYNQDQSADGSNESEWLMYTYNNAKECVMHTVKNSTGIEIAYRDDKSPINISKMTYIEFDLYVSEADIFSAAGDAKLELTSNNWVDNKEIHYDMKNVTLNVGWNHVKLALADFSAEGTDACDKEAIDFMRLYTAGHGATRTMTVKVDDVKFTKEGAEELVWTNCDSTTDDWWFNPATSTSLSFGPKNRNAAESTKIYTGLNDYSNGDTPVVRTPASVFGEAAEGFYFTTVSITGIGAKGGFDFRDATMAVKPYWITLDGTYVEGMGEFNRVNDAGKVVNVSVNLKDASAIAAGMLDITVPSNFNHTDVEVECGRVFEEMQSSVNTAGTLIKCVGNVSGMEDNKKANEVYVNLRFTVKDTDAITKGATDFTVTTKGFCNMEEDFDKNVKAWDVKY